MIYWTWLLVLVTILVFLIGWRLLSSLRTNKILEAAAQGIKKQEKKIAENLSSKFSGDMYDHGLDKALEYYVENYNSRAVSVYSSTDMVQEHLFMEALIAEVGSVEQVSEVEVENTIRKVFICHKADSKFLLCINCRHTAAEDYKEIKEGTPVEVYNQTKRVKETFPIEDDFRPTNPYVNGGRKPSNMLVLAVYSYVLVHSLAPEDRIKPKVIEGLIEKARVETWRRPQPEKTAMQISHRMYMGNPQLYTTQFKIKGALMNSEVLDSLYHKVPYTHKGKQLMLPMSLFVEVLKLTNHPNLAIGHVPGTGKTYLSRHIGAALGAEEKTEVFFLNEQSLRYFVAPEHLDSLKGIFNPKKRNIIFIDQIEGILSDNSEMTRAFLDLVDGTAQQKYSVSFIVVYNGQKETFNQAFFRSGRFKQLELGPLKRENVKSIIETVIAEGLMPASHSLDSQRLSDYINENQKDLEGNVIAAEGEILVCDIFDSFIEGDKASALDTFIEKNLKEFVKKDGPEVKDELAAFPKKVAAPQNNRRQRNRNNKGGARR